MGIKSFSRFLEDEAPASMSIFSNLSRYNARTMAIDVSIYMYKFAYSPQSTPQSCARQFLRMNERLVRAGIRSIYVFDGRPSAQKRDTIRQRAKRREVVSRQDRPRGRVTTHHFSTLKQMLVSRSISFLHAQGDAEKTCAWLCQNGFADIVASDDYDALAYGAPIVVRNLNNDVRVEIDRRAILTRTGLSESDFLNFCILCGCDFTPRGFRMGMERALSIVRSDDGTTRLYDHLDAAIAEFDYRSNDHPADVSERSYLPVMIGTACRTLIAWMLSESHCLFEETPPLT